jgi:hypothetical protein
VEQIDLTLRRAAGRRIDQTRQVESVRGAKSRRRPNEIGSPTSERPTPGALPRLEAIRVLGWCLDVCDKGALPKARYLCRSLSAWRRVSRCVAASGGRPPQGRSVNRVVDTSRAKF